MTAEELLDDLQNLIKKHGALPVVTDDNSVVLGIEYDDGTLSGESEAFVIATES